jgi:drug/metabolite transporter (DMT)-like permease
MEEHTMQNQQTKTNQRQIRFWQTRSIAMLLAALCAVAWSAAFPLIKIGLQAFQITSEDVGAKTLFAGIRFLAAGLVVMLLSRGMKRSLSIKGWKDGGLLLLFGLVNTALHYFCFYIGLSNMTGSRSAIIDSMGSFLLILLSCLFFPDDRMTLRKILGCVLGFGGVVIINLAPVDAMFSGLTFWGDGMVFLSAVSTALGGLMTRVVTQRFDPIAATGVSLTFGGALLMGTGWLMGGRISVCTGTGVIVLLLLIAISAFGFTIYNQLLCYNPVSEIAIFNALIPILGVLLSCLFLQEPFDIRYCAAGLAVTAGIYILNRKEK